MLAITSYSHAQFVYRDDTQIRVSPSHYMNYAAGENVTSCIQFAECDKATKLSVTETNNAEVSLRGDINDISRTNSCVPVCAYTVFACGHKIMNWLSIWREYLRVWVLF